MDLVTEAHRNLLAGNAGTPQTRLPADPAASELGAAGAQVIDAQVMDIVGRHPASSLGWALLAERALAENTAEGTIRAYAFARTGYHRGLDALRRSGWRGSGPVPWEHEPNRGFLRALWALSVAAGRIGETDEQDRCVQFLRDSSETGYTELVG
ncbi:DUF3151 domain-containing protein [Microlunatus sp. Gsoil 973]|jgi:hypothetical protein|uniref:DUF3151 domain-containing protein n=1 Tax=Microlunatus sp. Gsoil 973 TaxID=2672569 RepID=UPI0012B497C8|nr:DUF3151 domain-containing protein [Microlunatus sp. Gsoil 973]QGN34761.1 DUF3151 family protein [Microlunatus sp. Gsoil 973]